MDTVSCLLLVSQSYFNKNSAESKKEGGNMGNLRLEKKSCRALGTGVGLPNCRVEWLLYRGDGPQSRKYLVSITSLKRSLIPDLGERERGWTWDMQFDYLGRLRTPTGSVIMNFSERGHCVHDCHQQPSAAWG